MNIFDFDWWINWFEDWVFAPDKIQFYAGIFIGFLFFCCLLFFDDVSATRRYKKRKDEE